MNTKISFKEMGRKGKELLDKQEPVTFEQAKAQVERLRKNSKCRLSYSTVVECSSLTN